MSLTIRKAGDTPDQFVYWHKGVAQTSQAFRAHRVIATDDDNSDNIMTRTGDRERTASRHRAITTAGKPYSALIAEGRHPSTVPAGRRRGLSCEAGHASGARCHLRN